MNNNASRFGIVPLITAIVAVLVVGVMMFGARFGLWEPIVGFRLIRTYMNSIAYGVIGLGVVGLIYQLAMDNRPDAIKAGAASLIGMGLLLPMIYGQVQPSVRLPPIHDITTDTNNPPAFLALDGSRAGAKNTLVYGGTEIAALQNKAYPDIAPIQSTKSAPEAFAEALRVGKLMGWTIVAEERNNLRFEAVARTPIYRFIDDVVVVVTAIDSGSRIDIRSVSRIGRGDMGVNAARIREFIEVFKR